MTNRHVMSTEQQIIIPVVCEESVCRMLRERTGIVIRDHQLKNLRDTLAAACVHFNYPDPDTCLQALLSADALSPEFEFLIAGVTIGESYFFRDDTQMAFLREVFLPSLISRRRAEGSRELRIWSAGCSQGQELYSIAIMLHELLPDIRDWKLHLLGTDINTKVLGRAMQGHYHEWSLRAVDAGRRRYFRKINNIFELDEKIRHGVKFSYLNLRDDSYPSILSDIHALDLILCRNVLIYLQQPTITKIIGKLRDSMRDDAILMLGATDTMDIRVPELVMQNQGYVHYFQKAVAAAQSDDALDETMPAVPEPASRRPTKGNAGQAATTPSLPDKPGDVQAVIALIQAGKWQQVVDITAAVDGDQAAILLQFRAKAQANLGQLQAAVETCERALELDATDKHSYFIYALVLLELERIKDAEAALNKGLFLDRGFIEAYYQLGLLMIRSGRHKAGIKNLVNAMEIAEQGDPERGVHDSAGMTYGRFAQVLRSEISMYKELYSST